MEKDSYEQYGLEAAKPEENIAATPTTEMVRTITYWGGESSDFNGWFAVPSLKPPTKWLSRKEIYENGAVDIQLLLAPFLGNPIFDQTLRTIDVANGCGRHCGTCLADSQLPSKIFEYESYLRLLKDENFIRMLQPDSFRFGSAGDILDHPRGVEMVQATLDATVELDEKRNSENSQNHHKIRVFSNYLPNNEGKLDGLIKIAMENPDRISLCISLPFNKTDVINQKFGTYVASRPNIFKNPNNVDEYGLVDMGIGYTKIKNIHIQDVRHPRLLFKMGRNLAKEVNAGRVPDYEMVEEDRELAFADSGLVKLFLNPDALWLMAYASPVESHTNRIFTPVTTKNIFSISQLPYHPDFPTPPNWPGGSGQKKSYKIAQEMQTQARKKKYRQMKTVY